ncbi:MAG: GC-type dockerin domain-anchored protein [Phycisphaerales bacterium JB039]
MFDRLAARCCALVCVAFASSGVAQDEVVASNSWRYGQTAGIRAQVLGDPAMLGDIWVIEDFGIDTPAQLTTFRSSGIVNPAAYAMLVEDVVVQIRDGMPPDGNIILQSVAGAGFYRDGALGRAYFETDFGARRLEAGDYIIMWAAVLPDPAGRSIIWHEPGAHDVGRGEPANGFYWRPDTGDIVEVPLELGGGGRSGLNFTLRGIPEAACYADCDGDGELTFFDFLCFQNLFAAGDPGADCDADGSLTFFDFLCFQNEFAAGCP